MFSVFAFVQRAIVSLGSNAQVNENNDLWHQSVAIFEDFTLQNTACCCSTYDFGRHAVCLRRVIMPRADDLNHCFH